MDYDDDEEQPELEEEDVFVEKKASFELMTTPHELADQEIKLVQVQNNVLAIVGVNGKFLAQDQFGDEEVFEAKVKDPHKLFLDPAGNHCIISTTTGELYYFNLKVRSRALRFSSTGTVLNDPKNRQTVVGKPPVIESVGWEKHAEFEEVSTGTILLGSREGLKIIQLMISLDRDGDPKIDDCHEIGVLPIVDDRGSMGGSSVPIIAIETENINEQKAIFCATPCNLYGVAGSEIDTYEEILQEPAILSINMPMVEGFRGAFTIFRSVIGVDKVTGPPHSFVWCSTIGLLHGVFAKDTTQSGGGAAGKPERKPGEDHEPEPIIAHHETICFGPRYEQGFKKLPTDVAHSSFHMYVVHEDKMIIVGHPAGLKWVPQDGVSMKWTDFEEKVKFEPFRHRVTRTRGVIWDECKHKAYCYNNTDVWEVNVEREHVGFWKPFLERALDPAENAPMRERYFGAAMKLTREIPNKRDIVAMHFGRYWLKRGKKFGKEAISVLDKCSKFEEVYHLLAKERSDLVLPYIKQRYEYLVDRRKAGTEQSQIACLVTVVTAMYLEEIARSHEDQDRVEDLCQEVSNYLHGAHVAEPKLFDENRYYLMVHNLIASHGYDSVILDLAKDLKRWRFTVGYSTTQQDFQHAIAVLDNFCDEKSEIWVEFASTLMRQRPVQFLEAMRRNSRLEKCLHKFLPAFLLYSKKHNEKKLATTTIDYLHNFLFNCLQGSAMGGAAAAPADIAGEGDDDEEGNEIKNIDDGKGTWEINSTSLRDYYIAMLSNNKAYTEELQRFLQYDDDYTPEFALRTTLERKLLGACVVMYRKMQFPEDAIEVALEIGRVDDAKDIVHTLPPDTPPALKKRVWIQLVEYYVVHGQVNEAIEYINNSEGVLRMEDVLSKVTDTTVIQGFKDPICERLDDYSGQIRKLDAEMKHATESAKNIKEDIEMLKARFGYVSATQRCEICRKSLLHGSQPFLVYPSCRHVCHENCVIEHLNELGGLDFFAEHCPEPGYLDGIHTIADLANAECIFCGECAVLEINAPFILAGGDRTWAID